MNKPVRIVFMGTAAFAVPTLDILRKGGLDVAAVVTAPDKPAGRGKKIRPSPVKEYALNNKLPVLQPVRLSDESFVRRLQDLKPEIQVVVAFRMLPEAVWKIPPKGTMNLHASLLPQFRGAAPINHAIISGSRVTGLTTFLIDEKIDTGRILKQLRTPIGDSETAGELHDRLMILGAELTLTTIRELISGKVRPTDQDDLIPDEGS
jgi:methionyl-tRNA formyltransferase